MIDYNRLLSSARRYPELHIKIGIDTGRFLCELATRFPHHFYVGIEVRRIAAEVAYQRVRDLDLHNVVVVHTDAQDFISRWPLDGIVDAIHIYHPTPDPRTVGLRDPLLNHAFARDCARILRVWGTLRLVTDDPAYFDHAMELFHADTWWSIDWIYDDVARARRSFVGSPTELSYRARGATIQAAQFLRRA